MQEGRGRSRGGASPRMAAAQSQRWNRIKASRGLCFIATFLTITAIYAVTVSLFIQHPNLGLSKGLRVKSFLFGGEERRDAALDLVEQCLADMRMMQGREEEERRLREKEREMEREREQDHDAESERLWQREGELLAKLAELEAGMTGAKAEFGPRIDPEASWVEHAAGLLVRAWEHSPLLGLDVLPPTGIVADILKHPDFPSPPYLEDCELQWRDAERWDTRQADGSRPVWSLWARNGGTFELDRSLGVPADWLDTSETLLGLAPSPILGPYPPWVKGADEDNFVLTRRVQRDIWLHQHPKDCSSPNKKFLWVDVLEKKYFGFGAQLSELTGALGTAIERNWILVDDKWDRANHTDCTGKDHGRFSCYFRDLVSEECYVRAKELSLEQSNFGQNIFLRDIDYWGDAAPRLWGEPWSLIPPTSEADGRMVEDTIMQESRWWRAQAYRYLLRFPTKRTCGLMNHQRHRSFAHAAARATLEGQPPPSWLPASMIPSNDAQQQQHTKRLSQSLQQHQDGSTLIDKDSEKPTEGSTQAEGASTPTDTNTDTATATFSLDASAAAAGGGGAAVEAEQTQRRSLLSNGAGLPGMLERGLWRRQKAWIPRPLLSVHVRQGDKAIEMELVAFDNYMELASRLKRRFPHIRHIWLSTEMQAVVDATAKYPQWEFHYTRVKRQEEGVHMHDYEDSLGNQVATDNAVVNLLMAEEADFYVGALGSTWCYVLDSLRCTGGKLLQGYLSVNRDRHW